MRSTPRHPDLRGKIVLVTGAAGGIGAAVAASLADRGASLVLTDLDGEALEDLARRLRLDADAVMLHKLDVTSPSSIESCVSAVVNRFGGLDGLINVAGVLVAGDLHDIPACQAQRLLDTNLRGPIQLTQACLPHLIPRRGFISSLCSVSWLLGSAQNTLYNAAKAGLFSFSWSLRGELHPFGVAVSVVCPWLVDTKMIRQVEALAPALERAAAVGLTKPEEIAEALLRGVARGRFLILPGAQAKLLWFLYRLSPSFLSWLGAWIARGGGPERRRELLRSR